MKKRILSIFMTAMLFLSVFPFIPANAETEYKAQLTFADGGISETVAGEGYTITGTTLEITASGNYRISGSCAEGAIIVSKGLSGAVLTLEDLDLTSSVTAPIVIKKSSSATVIVSGTVKLTDNEDASTEETNEDFEGAAIKIKSGSTLTIKGDGTLNVYGNTKNGIKGASESALIINGGTINAIAENNGIAADGSVTVNAGTVNVTAGNDGIKAVPDETDTASAGSVTVNGGTLNINVQGDGIQAGSDLTITNGTFSIKTMNGYNGSGFNSDTMSAKGLKASGNETDTSTENASNNINISGGTFTLNTRDDAIHSDGHAVITGGTFYINTGDDGVHADTSLTIGTENGYERDPEIYIYNSYEGLESGSVYIYSGKIYVTASDDGINAAGGSSNGSDPGGGGGNHFNPGGRPGGQPTPPGSGSTSDYSLNIYGGTVYVNCTGDGLDSNGALNLYGGDLTVLSQARGGDNSPLDSDGTLLISGATVFAAGTNPMNENPSSNSQSCFVNTTQRNAETVVNINYGGATVSSVKLLRQVNYVLYSSPSIASSGCSITTASSETPCKNAWTHVYNDGVTSDGITTYTCTLCSETERKTAVSEYVIEDGEEEQEEQTTVYTANFITGEGATINVYYTQDRTTPNEMGVTQAIARNSDTGASDGTGDGQINFTVVPEDGYELVSVSVEGTYKNLKELGTNEYRITKISSDLTVTVTTSKTASEVLTYDANGDGAINNKDVTALFRYLSGDDVEINLANADCNGDGDVNNKDITVLFRYLST